MIKIQNVDKSKDLLVTAKEFIRGEPGKDGYTPVKGIDYFDGKDGEPGKDGKDGIYVGEVEPNDDDVMIWINPEGTITGSFASTQYVDDAIAAIELMPGPAGKDGQDGKDGEPGKDGENGKDYVLTENDKDAIAELVVAKLPVYKGEVV